MAVALQQSSVDLIQTLWASNFGVTTHTQIKTLERWVLRRCGPRRTRCSNGLVNGIAPRCVSLKNGREAWQKRAFSQMPIDALTLCTATCFRVSCTTPFTLTICNDMRCLHQSLRRHSRRSSIFLRAEVTRAPSARETGNVYYATFVQGANGVTEFFRRTQVTDGALQFTYDANCVIRSIIDSNFELSYSV